MSTKRGNILKKITKRVTGTCGTVTKDPAFAASKLQKESRRMWLKDDMMK